MGDVFTASEVLSLNAYQKAGVGHPYTCPNDHSVRRGEPFEGHVDLHATPGGLVCWWPMCDYEQQWARDYTKDWTWMEVHRVHDVL